ncbi:hypothetical protein ATY77_26660 [Rhizobium sp. R634]|uniref:hypothetical protein n=1 Tax=Rhizobium sp. R634 TaxID=1764274 RepID=UPI000B52C6DB|nr:hypothetical protein [Rhizobium sp. R634]OWV79572.1 hypothetical protein ATY77_26660 [Rhizobium sp. R634]
MKLFEQLKIVLGKPDAGSIELRAALAAIDLAPLNQAVTFAEKKRAVLLLDGTEAQLDKQDEILKAATRERDRVIAAHAELSRRLAEAEKREASEAFEAEISAVKADATETVDLLLTRFPGLQNEMTAIFRRVAASEERTRAMNEKLIAAGRSDLLPGVEATAFPPPPGQYEKLHSILRSVLMPVPSAPGWPADG